MAKTKLVIRKSANQGSGMEHAMVPRRAPNGAKVPRAEHQTSASGAALNGEKRLPPADPDHQQKHHQLEQHQQQQQQSKIPLTKAKQRSRKYNYINYLSHPLSLTISPTPSHSLSLSEKKKTKRFK
jgi:hypothetical protein